MDPTLPELLAILDLESIELNQFRAHHPPGTSGRVFGGQIMAQALMAAGRTVPDTLRVHSLHGYFLRPGNPDVPVLMSVDRIRDGRSFATRRVVATQRRRCDLRDVGIVPDTGRRFCASGSNRG
jgi:acyl-CoA thioesterase-2